MQHQASRVSLALGVVNAQTQECAVRVRDARFGDLLRDRAEGIEALGNGPGKALLLCLILDVAGCHVNSEDVACLAQWFD